MLQFFFPLIKAKEMEEKSVGRNKYRAARQSLRGDFQDCREGLQPSALRSPGLKHAQLPGSSR